MRVQKAEHFQVYLNFPIAIKLSRPIKSHIMTIQRAKHFQLHLNFPLSIKLSRPIKTFRVRSKYSPVFDPNTTNFVLTIFQCTYFQHQLRMFQSTIFQCS